MRDTPKSFRLPPDIVARLTAAAKHERLTQTHVLVRLLDKHLPALDAAAARKAR